MSTSFANLWTIDCHAPISKKFSRPGKNTGVSCHFLLQGVFLTQGSNPHLLLGRWILYHRTSRVWSGWVYLKNMILILILLKPLRRKNCSQLLQFRHSVMSHSLWTHEPQHSRPPCPSPTPRVYSDSCPSSRWCHPGISSSVVPFSSLLSCNYSLYYTIAFFTWIECLDS